MTPEVRTRIYVVGTAVLALLVGYRLIDAESAPLWLDLLTAGVGLATTSTAVAFRPTKNPPEVSVATLDVAALSDEQIHELIDRLTVLDPPGDHAKDS